MASDIDVLIIGAGQSGLGMAVQLIRKYGTKNFEIIEKSSNIGGTWFVNSYPGCGCDVPSHFYSFSFELNPNWSQKFAMQQEIADYFQSVAEKYHVAEQITFNARVVGAEWDDVMGVWVVKIMDNRTRTISQRRCKVLVSAVGALSVPRECEVAGATNYEGTMFHSASWDHNCNLEDKNVVVLGNGCSATQFVPIISEKVRMVTQFSRQPHWLLERPNPTYSSSFRWVMKWVPGAMRIYRAFIYAQLEAEFRMFDVKGGTKARADLTSLAKAYIEKEAPPKYRDALIPTTEIGCKRRVMDTGYLACLHRENVELVYNDSVEEILSKEVRTRSGKKIKADVIILANGFQTHQPMYPMDIKGKDAISLKEHWDSVSQGVPQAYYGTCVDGFPNFFVMMGPNTATGHLSVIYTSECQINFTLRMIDPIISKKSRSLLPSAISSEPPITTIVVTADAEKRDNDWIQEKSKNLVWSSGCTSWYIDRESKRNIMLYPSWEWHYWLRSIFIPKGDFEYSTAISAARDYYAASGSRGLTRYLPVFVAGGIGLASLGMRFFQLN